MPQEDLIIRVPDCSANDLLTRMEEKARADGCPYTSLSPLYRGWDFMHPEVRGKAFRPLMYLFGRYWGSFEGCEWAETQNADGAIAPFLVWEMEQTPTGLYVTIPSRITRLFRNSHGNLYAPYFYRGDAYREFDLGDVHGEWDGDYVLVAFQAI